MSLWEAIRSVTRVPQSNPSNADKVYSLQELSQKAKKANWGPIVVFAEVIYHPLLQNYVLKLNL
jgi:hypothetical protein